MPSERPIIPKGMPNPIGPAIFEGVRNSKRIGGELPVYKYPLVSKAPKGLSSKTKLVSTDQVYVIWKAKLVHQTILCLMCAIV